MPIDERLSYLLVGCVIGFVLGYFTRLMRDIRSGVTEMKEELDEVKDEIEHDVIPRLDKNEGGFMRYPWIANIAVLLTVGLTAYAAFVSQRASNDSQSSQDRIETAINCTIKIQGEALNALNERSTYTKATADANIDLQTSQARFFSVLLHKPPYSEARKSQAVKDYYSDLQHFLSLAKKGSVKVTENPFPTEEDLTKCIREGSQ